MRFSTLAILAAVLTYATILAGAHVRTSGASLGCPDWPTCYDGWAPPEGNTLALTEMFHRYVAAAAGIAILGTAVAAWRGRAPDPRARIAAMAAAILLPTQVALGGAVVLSELAPWMRTLHVGLATALFGAVLATAIYGTGNPRQPARHDGPAGEPTASSAQAPDLRTRARDHATLAKPRIVGLLLLTAVAGYLVAAGGAVDPTALLGLVVGGALAAAGCGAINQGFEAETDRAMTRTRHRPVAAGRVGRRYAMLLGSFVAGAGIAIVALMSTPLAALLTLAAAALYAGLYTPYLKSNTPQNIVIGGAAGAAPPLIGWAAATGTVALAPILMAGVIFLWTPAHFWALAIARRRDYEASGLPMAPVVWGVPRTRTLILAYAVSTVAASMLLWPFGGMGWLYLLMALLAGAGLLLQAAVLWVRTTEENAMRFFRGSIAYMGVTFLAIILDRALATFGVLAA